VIVDEAHRGQYGFEEKVDINTGKVSYGFARNMRDSLPCATFIGFTATPISSKDRSTKEVFGDYIDIYDMTQAAEDGVTCPVAFEGRMIHLELDADALRLIDEEYDNLAISCEEYAISKSKVELSRLESILGSDQAITALCKDIIEDYENNRMGLPGDKAMIVAFSRAAAIDIYLKILELRPEWRDMIAVVASETNIDPESWHEILGNKSQREENIKLFKDASSGLKIIIVCDMLLTGFDAPSLATMYLYKPLRDHGLMQAISRVNRVFAGKTAGVIVDYIGIASALERALSNFTARDKNNVKKMDVSKTIYTTFMEKLGVCRDIFIGFDYSKFLDPATTDLIRTNLIMGGMNFLADPSNKDDKMNLFINEATVLKKTLPLCISLLDEQERHEVCFFLTVRTIATRISRSDNPISFPELAKTMNELFKFCIHSEGVIFLFSNATFSITDPNIVEVLTSLGPHLAIFLMHRICVDQVHDYKDLARKEKFSEMLTKTMEAYKAGTISTAETLNWMVKTAKDLAEMVKTGDLKLSVKGLSVFEELCKNEAIREFFSNNDLADMVRAVMGTIQKKEFKDWHTQRQGISAMKRLVRDVVVKFSLPEEIQKNVMKILNEQLNNWNSKDDASDISMMRKCSSFYLNGRMLMIKNNK
jgi:type I restriction enzyme R subunit